MIVFMILVMTSLILVQTSSIIQALRIKEEQFDAAVTSSLSRVSERLEWEEASALAELANDISAQRGNGIFPSNNPQSISGTLSKSNTKLSFRYSQQASGKVYREELTIDYDGTKDQPEEQNERSRPGETSDHGEQSLSATAVLGGRSE